MGMNCIDAELMKRVFLAGARNLESNKEWINELNVFPVPDGDTGTNMTMTMLSAAREVAAIEEPTIENLARAISSGSLRGARGNSGVILSQLFRGFTKEIKTADTITTSVLADAFNRAAETAYKAVMKPKEGTILTVARGMADKASELAAQTDDILVFAEKVIAYGEDVLSHTPDMLPVLKEAGVVDSGGQGLIQVMKGCLEGLQGKELAPVFSGEESAGNREARSLGQIEETDIRYGYCTEFIINLERSFQAEDEEKLKEYLESIGDSLVVVSDEDIVKIHVHTNDPGLAIQKALTYGSLSRIKIDNMREEHRERLIKDAESLAAQQKRDRHPDEADAPKTTDPTAPRRPFGFVAVSVGEGLAEIFRGIGADYIVEGGQTMNPSTEDLLNAVDAVNADTVFILPNNKNIILAAEQAAQLEKEKKILVVPSKTIPQGITALINFSPECSADENLEQMTAEMNTVKSGQITYAVRSTTVDGMAIEQGNIMGIGDSGMLAVEKSVEETALSSLRAMIDEDSELVTVYYGRDVSEEEAGALCEKAKAEFPSCEIECHFGGQPIYYYILSVE